MIYIPNGLTVKQDSVRSGMLSKYLMNCKKKTVSNSNFVTKIDSVKKNNKNA